MSSKAERNPTPPRAPESQRRVRLPVYQMVGIGLLSLLPILAAFDRFGTRETSLTSTSHDVRLTVEHAPRVRYGLPTRVRIRAQATGGVDAGPVTVEVESDFLDRFAQISMFPRPNRIDADHHAFILPPSEVEGVVLIELEPEHYGPARGRVVASRVDGGAPVEIELSTFVYP